MKKTFLTLMIIIIISVTSLFAQTPTPSPPIAPDNSDQIVITQQDVKIIRQAFADKVYFENKSKQLEADYASCQNTSAEWQKLYRAEQSRADNIQGERINKLEAIILEKNLRIENYINQANQFRDENLLLQSDVKKLKKQRWKIGAITFGVGFGLGGVAGSRYL